MYANYEKKIAVLFNFESAICAALSERSPLFMSAFSSVGPGISDPRLLGMIFNFAFDFENPLLQTYELCFAKFQQYHHLWFYYMIKKNWELIRKGDVILTAKIVWKDSPELFYKVVKRKHYSHSALYRLARMAPNEKSAEVLLNNFLLPDIDHKIFWNGVMDYVLRNDAAGNTDVQPEVDLFVHELLFNRFPVQDESNYDDCENYVSLHWLMYAKADIEKNPENPKFKLLEKCLQVFKIKEGIRMVHLVDRLLESGDERLVKFWLNKKIKSCLDSFNLRLDDYSDEFWLLIKKLAVRGKNPKSIDGPK